MMELKVRDIKSHNTTVEQCERYEVKKRPALQLSKKYKKYIGETTI